MQTNDIKSLSIKDYLAKQNIFPVKEHPAYGMYKSPFRDEQTASFKVDYKANLWYDFGTGEGGSIIDLLMKMQQCNFIQAIEHLKEKADFHHDIKTAFSFRSESVGRMKLIRMEQSLPFHLERYLSERHISIEIAKQYLKTIHYQIDGRNYFALGFANDVGGYELRNPQFKGCVPPKAITTFDCNTSSVHLFEGFMDYLSLLTLQAKQADVSAVILNSVNNLEKAFPFLLKHTKINAFLDNDEAGKLTLQKLQKLNLPVADISKRYADFKDVNDYLCGKKLPKNQSKIPSKITKSKTFRI